MKIASIKATPVTIDFTEPEFWSQGERSGITAIIVELATDDGLVGIGESVPAPTPEVTKAAIESSSQILLGRDPRQISRLWVDLQSLGGWHGFPHVGNAALAGIEIACWDILGKSLGIPVHALFGGPIRTTIPVMGFVQHTTPEQIEKDARRLANQGFSTLYTKVGIGFDQDLAAVKALRRGGGDGVEIRVDANEAWTPGTALRMARALRDQNLQYIEQPIRMGSVEELATLRWRSPVPIAANQSSWLNWDVLEILKAGAVDVIMTDPWQAGGMANFRRAAALCETAGVPLVYHSFAPLSIAVSAAAQVICTSHACMYAHQTYSHMLVDDVVQRPIRIEDGNIRIGDAPGLGLDLDQGKLNQYHDAYLSRGYLSAYDRNGGQDKKAFFLPNY